mmetsp:Transcript_52668/g.132388  ORF Transcript_52668/g.132388 Transcript_52668/m.132388 type:complete len:259 (+) Transcript_52668:1596-2372(+)
MRIVAHLPLGNADCCEDGAHNEGGVQQDYNHKDKLGIALVVGLSGVDVERTDGEDVQKEYVEPPVHVDVRLPLPGMIHLHEYEVCDNDARREGNLVQAEVRQNGGAESDEQIAGHPDAYPPNLVRRVLVDQVLVHSNERWVLPLFGEEPCKPDDNTERQKRVEEEARKAQVAEALPSGGAVVVAQNVGVLPDAPLAVGMLIAVEGHKGDLGDGDEESVQEVYYGGRHRVPFECFQSDLCVVVSEQLNLPCRRDIGHDL